MQVTPFPFRLPDSLAEAPASATFLRPNIKPPMTAALPLATLFLYTDLN